MILGTAPILCCCRVHDGKPSSLCAGVPLRSALEVTFSSVSSGTKQRKKEGKKEDVRGLITNRLPPIQGGTLLSGVSAASSLQSQPKVHV